MHDSEKINKGPKAWLLLLNWKNQRDTIECLESIVRTGDESIAGIILCDNGSNDGSLEAFKKWFLSNDIKFSFYKSSGSDFVMNSGDLCQLEVNNFVLIDNQENLGFAAGNNTGLQFIQKFLEYDYVFLLNNDTVITEKTVASVVERFQADNRIGLCGSKVIYDHTRDRVQALSGAMFNPVLGRAVNIGSMSLVSDKYSQEAVEDKLDYILGAAMTISKPCLESIGLMEEKYFLYFEEIDWAVRAKRKGYKLAYSSKSEVFHKEGATIGSSRERSGRSLISEYYMVNSRIKFTFKFYPQYLVSVFAFSTLQTLRSVLIRDFSRAIVQLKAIFNIPFKR